MVWAVNVLRQTGSTVQRISNMLDSETVNTIVTIDAYLDVALVAILASVFIYIAIRHWWFLHKHEPRQEKNWP